MRNINVSFGGVRAVDDVSIDLYPGEVVGLVGGNGAGKSTLMKVLSGAQRADSGEILHRRRASLDPQPARRQERSGSRRSTRPSRSPTTSTRPGNLFLGRELTTGIGQLDDSAMEDRPGRSWAA